MTVPTVHTFLGWLQVLCGLAIMLGGLALAMSATDARTPRPVRWALSGLVAWGAWLAAIPLGGHGHDSMPALAVALLLAVLLLFRGHRISALLAGEGWPPAKRGQVWSVTLPARRHVVGWRKKIDPIWLLFGNEDDGWYGDATWRAGRPESIGLAVLWWLRNPCHNLTWYLIGVADRERIVTGRWVPRIHKPGGGALTCWTDVLVCNRWWLSLPFVSYLSPYCKFYLGWRTGGAFGIKLNLSVKGRPEWVSR
ncbi:hypothetical protein DEH84_07105 [Aquabacterium olei]|uniref:Uncharacterized protein n=1 Tax=Aquabacterium olei TaxID=1296669 RepID=A0A2U8FS44_9BURK|nr:hypothetical protein [Aquabacterium olei]AWI53224.1 hypothetical protein DEH84_07105 [Aquabacterium olei]